jgi:hypothetical protein
MRSREYLAAVKPDGFFLMLELMHFVHEIFRAGRVEGRRRCGALPQGTPNGQAVERAGEPEKYTDRYQEALKEVIAKKIAHQPITKAAPAAAKFVTDDIRGRPATQPRGEREESARPHWRSAQTFDGGHGKEETRGRVFVATPWNILHSGVSLAACQRRRAIA